MPSITDLKVVIYGDYNCPFCYALHEHLQADERQDLIEWRLIQHAPDVTSNVCTTDDQVELTNEVATVRHRAPDLTIALPPNRPNTRQANQITESLRQFSAQLAQQFRTLVYRALWCSGLDISKTETLQSLLEQLDHPLPIPGPQTQKQLDEWQDLWQQSNYDKRIPVMHHPEGQPLLGLASKEDILSYLTQPGRQPLHTIASCSFKPRPIIVLLGSMTEYWPLIQPLRNDYDLRVISGSETFVEFLDSPETIDLVLFTGTPDNGDNQRCLQVIQQRSLQHLSTIMLSKQYCSAEHTQSCQLGYNDYLHPDVPSQIIVSRISRLISLKRLTDQLQQQSNKDHLTGLYNRRELEHQLELEWLRATRSKRSLSLLMMDIDYFKQYNDSYGHLAGDDCLRTTALTIGQHIKRPGDKAFRYGGEEFILLLPETDHQGALFVAKKIQQQLASQSNQKLPAITLSIGISTVEIITQQTPFQLLELADKELLKAKQSGRNRVSSVLLDHANDE